MPSRWLISIISTSLLASSAFAHAKDTVEDEELQPQDFSGVAVKPPKDEPVQAPQREPEVEGIEGTMSEFDVRVVLEGRDADFDACHDRFRGGSGRISFRIHINADGNVGEVKARPSKVRNKDLIECYSEVVSTSKFNRPHGGYADVKWTTKVGRSRKKKNDTGLFGYDRPHRFDAPAASASSEGKRERRHHHRHHRSRKHRRS